ncbi:hypothetical protein [Bacillus thuringiensis]|uniref:Uncharacterized protein n=1 Tax=Bacillus thuringiensis serovar andalousiensis TaxID=257985 RepID=A0A6H0TH74_BACTU|nr:hypothetical protein [Bacillus thuringiensis]QIW18556.1 hypothetical protein EVG22_08795 [Bacillus thuringiensis serovar andalousiensis]
MRIRGQEWRDMKPEQKRKLLTKQTIENRNRVIAIQWKAMFMDDKQTFQLCTKACHLSNEVLTRS